MDRDGRGLRNLALGIIGVIIFCFVAAILFFQP